VNTKEMFGTSADADQLHLAEREFAAFVGAVTELFSPVQARLSAETSA